MHSIKNTLEPAAQEIKQHAPAAQYSKVDHEFIKKNYQHEGRNNKLAIVAKTEDIIRTDEHEMPFLINRRELFDREREQNTLFEAFKRCCLSNTTPNRKEFVLISGQSGTGKTCLAETLQVETLNRSGYFLRGKFDQNQRLQPFAPLVAVFTDFVNHTIHREDSNHVNAIKRKIKQEVALEVQLLLDMIPAFELILGPQEPCSYNYTKGATGQKINIMLRNLVRAICSTQCPMVILIDDLQWADKGSLQLLEALITDQFSTGIMIVGTCRDNEVKKGHEVANMLCAFEDRRTARICNIELFNLNQNAVNEWLSSILMLPLETTLPLANFVYKQTYGNFHFVAEIIRFLVEEGILYMYPGTTVWMWDDDELKQAVMNVDNIDHLESTKMEQLPTQVKHVIRMAACIGAEFEQYLLASLLPEDEVQFALDLAEDQGCIVPDPARKGLYRFAHDRIQQGAYSLIQKKNQNGYHLWFGRTLYEKLSEEQVIDNIFLVLDQLIKGKGLIKDQGEKYQVSLLCLRAAEKAIKSSDFVTASGYLKLGIEFLGERHWRDEYVLSLRLYDTASEVECCLANLSRMDLMIDEVIRNATSLRDKMRAYSIRVYSLGSRHDSVNALDLAFEVLERLGEPFPKKVRIVNILSELVLTRLSLKRMTRTELLDLPLIVNQEKLYAMQMMNMVLPSCFFCRKELLPLVACRMLRLTLKHGIGGSSSVAFAVYAAIISTNSFALMDEAYQYGQLAMAMVDKFQQKESTARVSLFFHGFVSPWKVPAQMCLEPLKHSMQAGLNTGDVESAALCGVRYSIYCLFSGSKNLGSLEKEMQDIRSMLVSNKQQHGLASVLPLIQVIHNFLGRSVNPSVLNGEVYDSEVGLEQEKGYPANINFICLMCSVIAYFFNDYELARSMSGKNNPWAGSSTTCEQLFYGGLTCLALAQGGFQKRANLRRGQRYLKTLRQLGRFCPESYAGKIFLMQGEIAVVKGNLSKALIKFQSSIGLSITEGSSHEQALACERAYLCYLHFGDVDRARNFAIRAKMSYDVWGATAKVTQLEGVIASL
mmetsp:Transcript_11429/g.17700  ORF Transcript_11429/g.17700 Transcript_11429/m.17700 type:complete len:1051 (-) Transcript_11429:44-3196(-)|eukprot:CAMPEP_0195293116 /NCGR_PEP_ID=MMETSP0707-20130614/11698_1 /TAXON_ID=33640 /ORGANISM="Asterionellopsis glacialis, Strain CCMP134" /LENGTH=1050 /DNA_ID=CAMNT_0040353753 /DNA_START=55 /DNA_END=3207 /DNA_ORIENTATION=-